ncbi:MAG: hypothetical protein Q8N09_07670, partial [Thermodesulfovibrionia bacterium]|nr:hypothetical protein [Thermodesulfovibrionia bacterium]
TYNIHFAEDDEVKNPVSHLRGSDTYNKMSYILLYLTFPDLIGESRKKVMDSCFRRNGVWIPA